MPDDDVNEDEGVGLPAVCTTVTLTIHKLDELGITAHGFMPHRQARVFYCRQTSCTVGLQVSDYKYAWN